MTDLSVAKRQEDRITAAQFFILLFTVTSDSAEIAKIGYQQLTYTQALVYCLPSMAASLALLIPACLLLRRFPGKNILQIAQLLLGKAAACILAVLFALCFLFVGTESLSTFLLFMRNTLSPQTPVWLLTVFILLLAVYGIQKGLETLVRTALCTGLFLLGATCLFTVGAGHLFSAEYREPFSAQEWAAQFDSGFSLLLGRSFPLTLLLLLQDQIRESPVRAAVSWAVGEHFFLALLLFLLLTCLGPYTYTQLFPLYTLSVISALPPIERLDALYLAVWLLMLVLRLGTYLFAAGKCLAFLVGSRKKVVLFGRGLFAACCGAAAVYGTGKIVWQSFLLQNSLEEPALLFLGGAVPLLLWLLAIVKRKKEVPT